MSLINLGLKSGGKKSMASWQAYVVDPILRLQVKRKLAKAVTVQDARAVLCRPLPGPGGVEFSSGYVGDVNGEWAIAPGTEAEAPILLYFHGGGYFTGSPQTHRPITGAYATRGMKVFAPEYRLAPEWPYPTALNDGLSAYAGMLAAGALPAQLAIGGDSAGGGLTLSVLLAAKAAHLPMPACALLFSPWTDLAGTGDSMISNRWRDATLVSERMISDAELYLSGEDPRNPLVSPLYGDMTGLPPLLIQVGEGEILRDDSTRLAARAEEAGVEVDLSIWPKMPHVFQVGLFLPEAKIALDQAVAFASSRLAKRPSDCQGTEPILNIISDLTSFVGEASELGVDGALLID